MGERIMGMLRRMADRLFPSRVRQRRILELLADHAASISELKAAVDGTIRLLDGVRNAVDMQADAVGGSIQGVIETIDRLDAARSQGFNLLNQTVNMNSVRIGGLAGGRRKRVLFLVHNIEVWTSLNGVFRTMEEDKESFEVIVASINRRYPSSDIYQGEDVVHAKLSEMGVSHIRLTNDDSFVDLDLVKVIRPDIIFRQSFWDADVPPAFSTENLRFARLYSVPYVLLTLINHGIENELMSRYAKGIEKCFVLNEEVKEYYNQNDSGPDRYYPAGHPRVDEILNAQPEWPLGDNPNFKVIWSAHHSIFSDWNNFGVFLDVYDHLLGIASRHPDIDFLFSPHPGLKGSFEKLSRESPKRHEAVLEFLARWEELPNTGTINDGGYIPAMKASDILVVDGISLLTEYQLVRKPIIFLESDNHVPFNRFGKMVAEGTEVTDYHSADGIEEAILHHRAGGEDKHHDAQDRTYEFLTRHLGAAQTITEAIKADSRI